MSNGNQDEDGGMEGKRLQMARKSGGGGGGSSRSSGGGGGSESAAPQRAEATCFQNSGERRERVASWGILLRNAGKTDWGVGGWQWKGVKVRRAEIELRG